MRASLSARPLLFALVLSLLSLLEGCLYTDVREPLQYGSPTPGDFNGNLGKEVTGSACNTGILWLVALGDGGYDAAVNDARSKAHAAYIADVKADTQYTNILFGIYQKQCTTVSGRVAAPPPATVAAAGAPTP
jgi:hypothetical protein